MQEDDEPVRDPAGWLAIKLRDLVYRNLIKVDDMQRIVNYGFESANYGLITITADEGNENVYNQKFEIIKAIFEDVLKSNTEKGNIINFLANNIFISYANLINIRNGYRNGFDIGYLYTIEERRSIVNDEIVREISYIMVGFGPLLNSSET